MYMQSRNTMSGKSKDEFNKPVESIMRCEDFKSNFARRLSNRYTSRSSVSQPKQDTELNLRPLDSAVVANVSDNTLEMNEQSARLTKSSKAEMNEETAKPPDKPATMNSDIKRAEVTVLNMEVETLRWQLAQTEANRQMHIALLKQVVAFLNRVKQHIERQNNETSLQKDTLPTRMFPKYFNLPDLPRSRSVVQVNKNMEYTLTTPKKISTRKISKSISNVNGFREYNTLWTQSKLSLEPEKESSQKISEEMSRLITLANTVLSTRIPDLAYTCNETDSNYRTTSVMPEPKTKQNFDLNLNQNDRSVPNRINKDAKALFKDSIDNLEEVSEIFEDNIKLSSCSLKFDNGFPVIQSSEREQVNISSEDESVAIIKASKKTAIPRKNDLNTPFIEDESGFSSMSSFQEIGIPIISIIPPSPSKEIGFLEEIPDLIDDVEKWKTNTLELEKQTMKVFWV